MQRDLEALQQMHAPSKPNNEPVTPCWNVAISVFDKPCFTEVMGGILCGDFAGWS